jgi:hypothetical protein
MIESADENMSLAILLVYLHFGSQLAKQGN